MDKCILRCAWVQIGYLSEMLSDGVWLNSVSWDLMQQLHQIILGANYLIKVKTSYKSQFCFF